jgi:phosphoglycerate dehydrogenase-like enzyme
MSSISFKCLVFRSSNLQNSTLNKLVENFEVLEFNSPKEISNVNVNVLFAFISPGYYYSSDFLSHFPDLRYVASNGTSLSHLDIELFRSKKIEIFSLAEETVFLESITPTSELALALALSITRNMVSAIDSTRNGSWNRNDFVSPKMFSRMKIGVVGLGRLGTKFAEYCTAMGAFVCFFDPLKVDPRFQKVELEELLGIADLVSIHASPNSKFPLYLDLKLLRLLKSDSFLVNTSRSEFIDHNALLSLLRRRQIAGVALDVVPNEYGHQVALEGVTKELFDFAQKNCNLILTPHIGGSTKDARHETESLVADHLIKKLKQL